MRWLAALLLLLTGCSADSSSAPTPATSTPTSTFQPGRIACGDLAEPATMPIRPGAARLLLCDSGEFPWRPPPELLREDLDGLTAEISALRPYDDSNGFCTGDGGSGFTIMLGYPDGDVTAVSGDTGGCSTVETGSGEFVGADDLLTNVVERFARARRGQDPPELLTLPPLDCNQGSFLGHVLSRTGRLRDASRAVSCWRPNAAEVGPWHVRDVASRDLRVLVRDALTHQTRRKSFGKPCQNSPSYYWQDLLIATTWGDVLVLGGVCDVFLVDPAPDARGESTYWHPSPRAQRILDRLRS